jgi:hypothetical protein
MGPARPPATAAGCWLAGERLGGQEDVEMPAHGVGVQAGDLGDLLDGDRRLGLGNGSLDASAAGGGGGSHRTISTTQFIFLR